MPANPGPAYGPTHEEIRAELTRILADRNFVRSDRMRRFLLLTVEQTLAGAAQEITEYALGREVFDRNKSYDPRIDSIVRVEARRLRTKLSQYYRESGASDPVIIEFQPGSYVPGFRYAHKFAPAATALNPRTVAVLPFVNLGGDPAQEVFCDGITEDILNALTTIPNLSVVARTSVFHFKGVNVDVRDIGTRLGAGTVVEGSVRRVADDLRISVKVINAVTGLLLWSGNFDRKLTDVFIVQAEIAQAIAAALRVTLTPNHPQSANLDAYMFYLKGRYYWNQRSQAGILTALDHFAKAVTLYPDYAPSHAALADAYAHLTVWGAIPPLEGAARARQAALEAIRLDDGLADAYATLGGIISMFDWNWDEGARLIARAIELQPSNVHALELESLQNLYRARFDESLAAIKKALKLDPLSPRGMRFKAWHAYYRRQYEKSVAILTSAIPLDATSHEGQSMLAWNYIRLGRYADAIALAQGLPEGPFLPVKLSILGEAHAAAGDRARAGTVIYELDELARNGYVSLRARVYVHCGLSEWDRVLPDLESSAADHAPWITTVNVDPRFDPLREDERFRRVLDSMFRSAPQ